MDPPVCIVTGKLEHSIWNKRFKQKTIVCVYIFTHLHKCHFSVSCFDDWTDAEQDFNSCASSALSHLPLQPFHPGAVTCCMSSWHPIHWVLTCSETASPPRFPGAIVLNISSSSVPSPFPALRAARGMEQRKRLLHCPYLSVWFLMAITH